MKTITRRAGILSAGLAIAAGLAAGLAQPSTAAPTTAAPTTAALPSGSIQIDAAAGFALSLEAGPDPEQDLSAVIKLGRDPEVFGGAIPLTQKFVAFDWGNDVYQICSISNSVGLGLSCLDVHAGSLVSGTRVVLRPIAVSNSQKWRIRNTDPVRPRTVSIQNVKSGLYADTGSGPVQNGFVRQRPFLNQDQQRWFIDAL